MSRDPISVLLWILVAVVVVLLIIYVVNALAPAAYIQNVVVPKIELIPQTYPGGSFRIG